LLYTEPVYYISRYLLEVLPNFVRNYPLISHWRSRNGWSVHTQSVFFAELFLLTLMEAVIFQYLSWQQRRMNHKDVPVIYVSLLINRIRHLRMTSARDMVVC